ncbi:adenosylcobinamide-phosphate synthase CbiB [Methylocapsa aurea]|uniref:adenosylcobinamide-phosphate synthase CbiB n=1 Tax=Methylocapsa aurea TaxID=663610 RepID=UPI0005646AC3|nr:adenosylcobinamide-phosphate synthase CbiB [Methylocapsa aurea]
MDLIATFTLAAATVAIEAGIGYPQRLFKAIGHPVTWIGALIARADGRLNHEDQSFARRRIMGALALGLILTVAGGGAQLLSLGLASLELARPLSLFITALIASSLIAQRSLHAHVLAVATALDHAGLEAAQKAVGAIVGRDVRALDETGVARAAIESLAENFSDGVVAPAFWIAFGGLPGGVCYKAINTADSMIGHRTKRHAAFGFAAAKLDDLVNFLPARLSALWISIAAAFLPGASPKASQRVARRDSRGHPSPNAGWPEAAFAGALGFQLGGPRFYGQTRIDDAWIGSGDSAAGARDIRRALALYRRACAVHCGFLALPALLLLGRSLIWPA